MLKVISNRRTKNVPDEYISPKNGKTYWERNGKFQKEHDEICKQLEERCNGLNLWLKLDREEISDKMLLVNGVNGLYYAKYNDGDDAEGAIDNNRVHGFKTVDKFKDFCKQFPAHAVIRYLEYSSTANLEKAMDEVVRIYVDLI
jgi:hypothetical protein